MSDSTSPSEDRPEAPVFSIPAAGYEGFPHRPVILRTADPARLRALLGPDAPADVAFIQVTRLTQDVAVLADWGAGLALDLVMVDPVAELPLLYRCTGLLDNHPLRVSVPFRSGLAPAVKLALSLGFDVRLQGHQRTPEAVTEARAALDAYLRNPTVPHAVEPFQSLLLSCLHATPVALWSVMERDPAAVCVIDEAGEVAPGDAPAAVRAFRGALLAAGCECSDCPWIKRCDSYFKWPRRDYNCTDIKVPFDGIQQAADALRADIDTHAASAG